MDKTSVRRVSMREDHVVYYFKISFHCLSVLTYFVSSLSTYKKKCRTRKFPPLYPLPLNIKNDFLREKLRKNLDFNSNVRSNNASIKMKFFIRGRREGELAK